LGTVGSGNADPLNRKADYSKPTSSITHDFRTNGTIELPIGPNKLIMGNSSDGWRGLSSVGRPASFSMHPVAARFR
jgi:hypothetical protein